MVTSNDQRAGLEVRNDGGILVLVLSGDWLLRLKRPAFDLLEQAFKDAGVVHELRFEADALGDWDTGLLLFVRKCHDFAQVNQLECALDGLPEGAQQMVALSLAVPEVKATAPQAELGWFAEVGEHTLRIYAGLNQYFNFIGRLVLDVFAFVTGRSQLRMRDFLALLQAAGPRALGIVCLLSFLMGLIIAFVGVIQLKKFAADIYVADLVALAMTRELAPVMLGVIMSGRTGAAFAAQIGSMQVNEEVDALVCFGISPMQFLVLPRVIALVLMMPLLCVCADLVSIFGGMVVSLAIADISAPQFVSQVQQAVALNDLFGGIFKSVVFGVIIAVAGCYRGLNCGKNASAVGVATTSAVVTSITWIVVADAIFAVAFQILGI